MQFGKAIDVPMNVRVARHSSWVNFEKTNKDEIFVTIRDHKDQIYDPLASDEIDSLERCLRDEFEKYGRVRDLYYLKSKYHYFGHFLVRFSDERDATDSMKGLAETEIYCENTSYNLSLW